MKKKFLSLVVLLLLISLALFFHPNTAFAHSTSQNNISSHFGYTIIYGKPHFVPAVAPTVTYGCHALSCDGKDPIQTRCNQSALRIEPIILVDFVHEVTIATGNNVYSKGCQANWTEADSLNTNYGGVIATGHAIDQTGKPYWVCFPGNDRYYGCGGPGPYYGSSGWPSWTDMVDGTNQYTACLEVGSYSACQIQ